MDFRDWLEMSMDLSNINDPFDKDFYNAVKKKHALVYHGTTTKWFWSIINNGFTFNPERKNWDNTTPGVYWSFDKGRTRWYTTKAVKTHGGEEMVFVAEIPIKLLQPDPDDSAKFDADTKLQSFSPTSIPSKYITGVLYPLKYNLGGQEFPPETPIRKFIQKVNKGQIPAISPEGETAKRRFKKATDDDVEYHVSLMLQDLIQYTNLAHWIMDGHWLFNQKVIAALHNVKWTDYMSWTTGQWLHWLEKVLGEKVNDESYDYIRSDFNYRTYQIINRYRDVAGFKQFRLGINDSQRTRRQ